MPGLVPVSIVIPTCNRASVLRKTLISIAAQSSQPARIVLVDASDDQGTRSVCLDQTIPGLISEIILLTARSRGAAIQRNEGISACVHPIVGFFDDDIVLEPECISRLWRALQSDHRLGGVNAMITNQRYEPPGRVSRCIFRVMSGQKQASYAGRVLGPAVNLLPEDRDDLPEVVPVQWLNTTCTFYRRDALPDPPFPTHFTGYSVMEDLSLSLKVGKEWSLANARTARIYHDSQPAKYKEDLIELGRMQLVNRHHVMTVILRRRDFRDYNKLVLWEGFQLAVCFVQNGGGRKFLDVLMGKILGTRDILMQAFSGSSGGVHSH